MDTILYLHYALSSLSRTDTVLRPLIVESDEHELDDELRIARPPKQKKTRTVHTDGIIAWVSGQ